MYLICGHTRADCNSIWHPFDFSHPFIRKMPSHSAKSVKSAIIWSFHDAVSGKPLRRGLTVSKLSPRRYVSASAKRRSYVSFFRPLIGPLM